MIKRILCFCLTATLCMGLCAFDWPQENVSLDSFYSYFGQLRGGTLEGSLIFKENADISASSDGIVSVIITEHTNDFGWFESTLGNAVLIEHENEWVTVYANLDEETFPQELQEMNEIAAGTFLGTSGNSGWQEGQSCLEFMVIDRKSANLANPRPLMPRLSAELPLEFGRITLDDSNGTTHYLSTERTLSSGTYTVYHLRQDVAVPYRSVVAVNGATVESISYDTLREDSGRLCVIGNRAYSVEDVYPDGNRQMLGRVQLTRGRAELSLTLIDILGTARTVRYNLDIN